MYIWLTERDRERRESEGESEKEKRREERKRDREREYLRNASYGHRRVVPSAASLAGMYASTAKPALAGLLTLPVPTGGRSQGQLVYEYCQSSHWHTEIYAMWPIFIVGGGGDREYLAESCYVQYDVNCIMCSNTIMYITYIIWQTVFILRRLCL